MNLPDRKAVQAALLATMILLVWAGCTSEQTGSSAPSAESKAIGFLQREVPAWSRENGCFSCHNNGDAARALYAARRQGYRMPTSALADTTGWVKQPARWEHNKGDPGFSDQRLANIQFAASLLAALDAGAVKDQRILADAAQKLIADQDGDGAWRIEEQNPIGSPATYGTALATFMAWQTLERAGTPGTLEAAAKAKMWLRKLRVENIPAAAVVLLAGTTGADAVPGSIEQAREFIRAAQTRDGGWGPYQDSPPEAFDTALALLALANVQDQPHVTQMIQDGRAFLFSLQLPDGSWPATTRPSGSFSYAQQLSTTGWVALALLATR